jgi:prophage regulatory protein
MGSPLTAADLEKIAVRQAVPGLTERLLTIKEVMAKTSLGSSTIYRRIEEGTFPRGRDLGGSCVRWVQSEIDEWIRTLPQLGQKAA